MRILLVVCSLFVSSTAWAADSDPFRYAELGSGWFSHPSVTERIGEGRDGAVDVFLFASGNFAVEFEEHTPSCVGVPGECRYDVPVRFWVEGRWSEANGVISLPGFGSARIDGDTLRVSVSDARATEAARGHVFGARPTRTTGSAYGLRKTMEYYKHSPTIPEVRDAVVPK